MSKISYLRKLWAEKYNEKDLAGAAEIGEVLLREHWHNKNMWTRSYSDDLYNLACVHEELGNLERAAELYSDSARQISEDEYETLPYAERITNLSTVLLRLGMTESAFFMLGNAAAIRRRELGTYDPLYADSLYNLANAAADLGRRNDSLRYHLQALRIRENEGHTEDIIHSLHSLAFLHESSGDYEKAASYAKAAMNHSVGDDLTFAGACNYLAGLYENSQKYNDALDLYNQVLEIAVGETGRKHSTYLNVALRRANLLALMQRHTEALEAHEEVSGIFARENGTKHIFYANCLRGMAMLQSKLNDPLAAEELILEAMKIRRKLYEDISLDIIFLIRLHLQENNSEKALEALIYALMCNGSGSREFSELLNTLAEMFAQIKTPATADFMNAMELLNNREKLRPIINKWDAWEKEAT